jgi:serine/threonine-protein kinase PknG
LANALLDLQSYEEADRLLAELETADPWDWRPRWYRGRLLLAQSKPSDAQQVFDQIYFDLPGELAPKLGFAMAAELAGHLEIAARMYDLVSQTNPDLTSACFGLARCLAALGDRAAAVAALSRVPPSCNMHSRSLIETARALISRAPHPQGKASLPGVNELVGASQTIEALSLEGMERYRLSQQVLATALDLLAAKALPATPTVRILGKPLREADLRQGLEESFRAMARLETGAAKVQLVDEANRVRPRTLL